MATQQTHLPRRGGGERFAPGLTLGEARAHLFALGGLGEVGDDGAAWVRLKLWRIPLVFPNTAGRRRAVRFHDLHHVLTEYPTTWRGETEIGAWEVATGLRRYWSGWLLDLLGFALGLLINPRGVYRAFLRGRCSANLYGLEWDDKLLSMRVGDVRRRLRLDRPAAEASTADRVAFVFWAALSAGVYVLTGFVLLLPLLVAALAAAWAAGFL